MGIKQLRSGSHLAVLLLILLTLWPREAAAQPKINTRWQGNVFIELTSDTTPGGIIWRIDTLSLWNEFIFAKIDSSLAGIGGISADSLDKLFTDGDRLLYEALLNPGSNGQVLTTQSGLSSWATDPELPDRTAQAFYFSYMEPQNTGDTTNFKHVAVWAPNHREFPVVHGSSFSDLRASIYLRDQTNYRTYTATITYQPGKTANDLSSGDKILFRFFPGGGTGTDKQLRMYIVPEGEHVFGVGGTIIYGELLGYWSIPAAYFPTSGTVNIDMTFSYKVDS